MAGGESNRTVAPGVVAVNHLDGAQSPQVWIQIICFPCRRECGLPIGLAVRHFRADATDGFRTLRFAIGSNEATARLCGIPGAVAKGLHLRAGGTAVWALAGLMQLSRLTQGRSDGGDWVGIGHHRGGGDRQGRSLNGGTGSVLGSMIGALIMAVLRNGVQSDGLAEFHAGDHHRHCDHHRGRAGLVAAEQDEDMIL